MVNVWLKYGYTNRTSHVLGPTKDEKHPWDVDIHRGPDIFQGYAHFAKEKKRKNPSTNPIMQSKCHRNPKCHRKIPDITKLYRNSHSKPIISPYLCCLESHDSLFQTSSLQTWFSSSQFCICTLRETHKCHQEINMLQTWTHIIH